MAKKKNLKKGGGRLLQERIGIHWSGAGVWTGFSLEKIKGKC